MTALDRARAFAEQYSGQRCPGIRTQDGARRAFRAAKLVARKIWREPWWLLYRGSELVGSAELSDALTVYGVELNGVRQDMVTVTRPAHVWAAMQRATGTEGLEPDLAVDALASRDRQCRAVCTEEPELMYKLVEPSGALCATVDEVLAWLDRLGPSELPVVCGTFEPLLLKKPASEIAVELGRGLRAVRVFLGLSLHDVALGAGLSLVRLSDVERGVGEPATPDEVERVLDALLCLRAARR